jgi:hypothetical protein
VKSPRTRARGAATIPAPLLDPPTLLPEGEVVLEVVEGAEECEVVPVVVVCGAVVVVVLVALAVVVEVEVATTEVVVVVVPLDEADDDDDEAETDTEELPVLPVRQLVEVPGSMVSGALKASAPSLSTTFRVTLVPEVMLTIQVIVAALVSVNWRSGAAVD